MLVSYKLQDNNQGSSVGQLKKNPNPNNNFKKNV